MFYGELKWLGRRPRIWRAKAMLKFQVLSLPVHGVAGAGVPQAGRREQQLRGHTHELPGEPRDPKDAHQSDAEEAVPGSRQRIEVSHALFRPTCAEL